MIRNRIVRNARKSFPNMEAKLRTDPVSIGRISITSRPAKSMLYRYAAPKWRSGQAVWCGFHHGSLANDMGHMGIIDYYRLPLAQLVLVPIQSFANQSGEGNHDLSYLGIWPPAAGSTEPEWPKPGTPKQIMLYPGVGSQTTIKNDGTDDTQLVVELVDEYGKRVDATADVTLTIVSGPGQFPAYTPNVLTPIQDW